MASRNIIEYKRIVARRVLKDRIKKKQYSSSLLEHGSSSYNTFGSTI